MVCEEISDEYIEMIKVSMDHTKMNDDGCTFKICDKEIKIDKKFRTKDVNDEIEKFCETTQTAINNQGFCQMLNPGDFAKVDRTSMMEHDLCGQCPNLNLCGFALCKSPAEREKDISEFNTTEIMSTSTENVEDHSGENSGENTTDFAYCSQISLFLILLCFFFK